MRTEEKIPITKEGLHQESRSNSIRNEARLTVLSITLKNDWIVQYDPPDQPKEYIHRVVRTARGEGAEGNALLFLIPEELRFLCELKDAKVPVKEYEFDEKKLINVQSNLVLLL
ncbi:UNVERIFIED_CONTAM: DEAD-box ATP-dependent RNA helicase 51 [Sesamum radiatum]|uniref:ATP-dependent RNA helicase n=1 Tax=Sesamum radiatum TaxID=300843 RepID=A0AAW2VC27_SESRA